MSSGVEGGGQHLRDLGLADARLALEEQRPPQAKREVDRHREPAVGDVALLGQRLLQLVDRSGQRKRSQAGGIVTDYGWTARATAAESARFT